MDILFTLLGLFASTAGLPIPEDAVLVAAGATRPLFAIAVGIPSVVLGDALLYGAGCGLAIPFRRHARTIDRARNRLARWGDGAIVIARFVPVLRGALCVAAGGTRFPLRRFLVIDTLAACIHVPLLVLAGHLVSS